MRASDADRQRVIDVLQQHTAAGRLTLDEFSDRVGSVYAARTLDDLRKATVDLPALESRASAVEVPDANSRHLILAFGVALALIVLLFIAKLLFG